MGLILIILILRTMSLWTGKDTEWGYTFSHRLLVLPELPCYRNIYHNYPYKEIHTCFSFCLCVSMCTILLIRL